jgi:hypothetical protein
MLLDAKFNVCSDRSLHKIFLSVTYHCLECDVIVGQNVVYSDALPVGLLLTSVSDVHNKGGLPI